MPTPGATSADSVRVSASTRRTTAAVVAAGISSFALLYAPQSLLPQLAERFHLTPGGASLAIGVATAALAVSVLPIAAVSELVGRRRIILTSVVASAVLGIALPLASSYPALLAIRVLQGVAIAGFPGVASAYLVEQLGRAGVAGAVGAMIAGNTVGGMTGRLLAGITAQWLGWQGGLAAVTAVALICSSLTVALLPRMSARHWERRSHAAGRDLRKQLRTVFAGITVRSRVLFAQYAVAMLAMGAFVALYNAATFRLTGQPLGLSPAVASLVFLAYAMGAFSSAATGGFVARFGRRRSLTCALSATVLGALLTLPDSLPLVLVGFVVLTGGFFGAHAVANGWAAAEAPQRVRGQVSGTYTLAYYLGSSVGGTVGSVVYGRLGWSVLVALGSAWLVLAAVVVLVAGGSRPGTGWLPGAGHRCDQQRRLQR